MQKLLLDALQRLTTPGAQTSEGKTHQKIIWSFLIVLGVSLLQQWLAINPTGSIWQIIGSLLGLFMASTTYTNSRAEVKEKIGGIIGLPVVQGILEAMVTPPKLGSFTPGTDIPTQKLTPEEMGITALPSLTSLKSLPSIESLQSKDSPAPIKIQPRQSRSTIPTDQELDTSDPNLIDSVDTAAENTWVLSIRYPEGANWIRKYFVGQPLRAEKAYQTALTGGATKIYLSEPGEPLPM